MEIKWASVQGGRKTQIGEGQRVYTVPGSIRARPLSKEPVKKRQQHA